MTPTGVIRLFVFALKLRVEKLRYEPERGTPVLRPDDIVMPKNKTTAGPSLIHTEKPGRYEETEKWIFPGPEFFVFFREWQTCGIELRPPGDSEEPTGRFLRIPGKYPGPDFPENPCQPKIGSQSAATMFCACENFWQSLQ